MKLGTRIGLALTLLACGFFAGCAKHTKPNFGGVKKGMTPAEVVKIMGKPRNIEGGIQNDPRHSDRIYRWEDGTDEYSVGFQNGRVFEMQQWSLAHTPG